VQAIATNPLPFCKKDKSMNELDELLQEYLVGVSADILKSDPANIRWSDDLDEYGFASITVNQLCAALNERFGIEMTPAVFLEYTSLEALSAYLKEHHYREIENTLVV